MSSEPHLNKLSVFVSSTMLELRDVREIVEKALYERGIHAWVFEAAGARPETVETTSLLEVENADIYLGLFWQKYGAVTAQEYQRARELDKPCFVYIRDNDIVREPSLNEFLDREVLDLHQGVTYSYFDSAIRLGDQVATDIMNWLVQQHREMTAQIRQARVSQDEISRLQTEVGRLQGASRSPLPQGTPLDYLSQQMRGWFEILGYLFESHSIKDENLFEWIINIPVRRRRYDRILVRGINGEIELSDVEQMQIAIEGQKTDEGWIVSTRRVSQAARAAVESSKDRVLSCFTFDELIDQEVDFAGYFKWIESEVKRKGIDKLYVPLACTKEEFNPSTKQSIGRSRYGREQGWVEGYIDRWLHDPSKEHISILGEFGTGKTWFALHYAWIALQAYLEAKDRGLERPRLPLVVPLRDYAKAVSVESLFSDFFFRKHEIRLSGYSAFLQLNRMGKLVLIFDGFDEMAAKVDRQKMINNFWELARVVVPGSKAILTSRTEHFPNATEGRALLNAELLSSTDALTGEPPQFEVVELQKFDDEQIRQALSLRVGPKVVQQVIGSPELLDLARRPVMTDFILEALPDIEAGRPVDLSRVYLYAVSRKMERDITSERTFTSLADKLFFLCELSWEMLSTDQMSLNYKVFPEKISRMLGPSVQEQKDLDHWHYDMMGQTMLIRNADGDYTPAHRSLLEFFVAYKFAAELGLLAPDFTALSQSQSHIDTDAKPQAYSWSSYFKRDMDTSGNLKSIPPLMHFEAEEISRLAQTVGRTPITKAILDLIENMLESGQSNVEEQLLALISLTRGRSSEDSGVVGGNAATMLIRHNPLSLQGRTLPGVNLTCADFQNANLTGVTLEGANLQRCIFRGVTLERADLSESNLTDAEFREMGRVQSVAISPTGQTLVSGGEDANVHVWHLDASKEILEMRSHRAKIQEVCWASTDNQLFSAGEDGSLLVWDLKDSKPDLGATSIYNDSAHSVRRMLHVSDAGLLICGTTSGRLLFFDSVAQPPHLMFSVDSAHNHWVADIRLIESGLLLTAGGDHRIRFWRMSSNASAINDVGFDKRTWRYETHTESPTFGLAFVGELRPNLRSCYSLDISKAGLIALGSRSGVIDLSQKVDAAHIVSVKWSNLVEHSEKVVQLRFIPDQPFLCSIDVGGKFCIWETSTRKLIISVSTSSLLCLDYSRGIIVCGTAEAAIEFRDGRPFINSAGEPYLGFKRSSSENPAISFDQSSWPLWWQKCRVEVPDGFVPNPAFGECLQVIDQKVNCKEMKLKGAKGLDAIMPNTGLSVKQWLEIRGAIPEDYAETFAEATLGDPTR